MSNTLRNFIMAISITVVMSGGYFYYQNFRGGDEEDPSVYISTEQILEDIRTLDKYPVDQAVFASKAFSSLRDYRVPVEDIPGGRANPYLPVE